MLKPRVAIIGGGIAGLIAALNIADAGGQPTIFEAGSAPGGRAKTREIDGFFFNQGPHALYVAGAFYRALHRFGVCFGGGGPDLPNGLAIWTDGVALLPVGFGNRNVAPLDEPDVTALNQLFAQIANGAGVPPGTSLAEALAHLPPRAQAVVEAFVRLSTYVHAPTLLDAAAAFDQMKLSFSGTLYVDGGWGTLVNGLREAALSAEVVVRTRSRVSAITSMSGSWSISASGVPDEIFEAVVLAVSPRIASQLLPDSETLANAASQAVPVRFAGLNLALHRLPSPEVNFALGIDMPEYLSVHSATAALAPAGGALVHLGWYLTPGKPEATDSVGLLENMADQLQTGWRDVVRETQRLTGATVAHDFPRAVVCGRRAEHVVGDTPGVFVAGDWVGDRGMLADAAAASAEAAAFAAMEHARALASTLPSRMMTGDRRSGDQW